MSTLKPLNRQTAGVPQAFPERIIQFGGGNFLRGFVDWMVEVLNQQAGFAGSVVIVKPTSGTAVSQLNAQEGLFHVRLYGLRDGGLQTDTCLITCVTREVNTYQEFEAFLSLARQPEIRFVVSNTTESGLIFAPNNLPTDRPPSSFPAKLTLLLYQRFQYFQGDPAKGCIILPTELVEDNGALLKKLMLQYAALWGLDPEFAVWLSEHNLFCNTLVDRIVPGFPKNDPEVVLNSLGYDDQLLVEGEQYHSWVIQAPASLDDELPFSRTGLNVRITDDVTRYRDIKVRILNGTHTAMTPLGILLGLETVQQAVEHPLLGRFIHDLLYNEIVPSLNPDDLEIRAFADQTLNRFRNPFIHHRLSSIALNSISKFKVRLLPSLFVDHAKTGRLPGHIVVAFAALIRFYKGEWHGTALPLNDDPALITWFQQQWADALDASDLVKQVLANTSLWGQDLSQFDGLADALSICLVDIERDGVLAVLSREEWL